MNSLRLSLNSLLCFFSQRLFFFKFPLVTLSSAAGPLQQETPTSFPRLLSCPLQFAVPLVWQMHCSGEIVCELSPTRPPGPLRSGRRHDTPVEDRLLQLGKEYDERRKAAQIEKEAEIQREIAEQASIAARNAAVAAARRQSTAFSSEERAAAAVSRQHRQQRRAAYVYQRDAGCTYRPSILPASRQLARDQRVKTKWGELDIGSSLLQRRKTFEEQLQSKRLAEEQLNTYIPAINTAPKTKYLQQPVVDRLYRAACSNSTTANTSVLGDITNRHRVTAPPRQAAPALPSAPREDYAATYRRLFENASTSRRRPSKAAGTTDDRGHPQINQVSALIASKRSESPLTRLTQQREIPSRVDPFDEVAIVRCSSSSKAGQRKLAPIAVRSHVWERQRERRLQALQAAKLEEELQECRFQPRIGSYKGRWSCADSNGPSEGASSKRLLSDAEQLLHQIDTLSPFPASNVALPFGLEHHHTVKSPMVFDEALDALKEAEAISRNLRVSHLL